MKSVLANNHAPTKAISPWTGLALVDAERTSAEAIVVASRGESPPYPTSATLFVVHLSAIAFLIWFYNQLILFLFWEYFDN